MLVLSRKAGESILLHMRDGRTVDVKVTEIVHRDGALSRVRLGISAPDDVIIMRQEVPLADGPRVWVKEQAND